MNKFWWSNNKSAKGIHWTLLAKTSLASFSQPNCLLPKVLKARYYPFIDILSAKFGSYPSFICSAQDLIAEGIIWHINSGACANMWNDPWLPGPRNSRLSVQNINPSWTTMNQLIDADTNTWNKELISRIVDDDQANRIFSISLSGSRSVDLLVWKYEATGEYSVKSVYRVLVTEQL
ncbi:Polynucleotidyl transferase, Ribonuclease H fold [Gossypium australe]|uniref:Polynucleotidyl transferase, Ribonuclease H fold n=1 Tax=Gossypium australe TaxID=47621 RepID=A0A5B6W925_9ROSI|nr:Polynucleotidyl transferase, Ribonuclease H fold [Gossypium australe]